MTPERFKKLTDGDSISSLESILAPKWSDSRIHNWHNHVPDHLADLWETLSDDARVAVYVLAKIQSDNEEWD